MRLFAGALLLLLSALPGLAAELGRPTGDVLLTVKGEIGVMNADGTAELDRAMLEAMPVTRFKTKTNWTEGEREFAGVLLSDLLEALGSKGSALKATALNDYTVEIPVSDAKAGGPIIAYALDGEPMSVRDKGPLWIVYPYDSSADYRTETIYARSIWQLDRIEVVD